VQGCKKSGCIAKEGGFAVLKKQLCGLEKRQKAFDFNGFRVQGCKTARPQSV